MKSLLELKNVFQLPLFPVLWEGCSGALKLSMFFTPSSSFCCLERMCDASKAKNVSSSRHFFHGIPQFLFDDGFMVISQLGLGLQQYRRQRSSHLIVSCMHFFPLVTQSCRRMKGPNRHG